jgi:regulator of protease activity HflC (stomatin/prohibitin superfamily)
MNSTEALALLTATAGGFGLPWLATQAFRAAIIEVEDEEAVLVTRHGKVVETLTKPGLHVYPARSLPWVQVHRVSLARDFRVIENLHVNDVSGTSVVIDLWLEFRIVDPVKALFAVDDWEKALHNVVSHSALSVLSTCAFDEILSDRGQLGEAVHADIADELDRWGLEVELVLIKNVSLMPEVGRQVFETVAAKLERAKADVEEEGRLRVALLEAQTSARVAALLGEAKAQYPLAVGKALAELRAISPEVLEAYEELYELSMLRPHRTWAFMGWEDGEIGAADAAMMVPAEGRATVGENTDSRIASSPREPRRG